MRRCGVRIRMMTPDDKFDLEFDSGIVAHSVAEVMTIAEGLSVAYRNCLVQLEQTLLTCWRLFDYIGDVTISMSSTFIVMHTRHANDATHQMHVVVSGTGVVLTTIRVRTVPIVDAQIMNTPERWAEFVETLGHMPMNPARKIRTAEVGSV